jgi:hypothetical protein
MSTTHRPRRLKVRTHYRQLAPQLRTTARLLLLGNWLAAAGFGPGITAVVQVESGRLIITPGSEVHNG